METRRDVFQAIADPTRRAILGLLAEQSLNVNALAEQFDMSRQAVSLHVKILSECGLLSVRRQGRERYCDPHLDELAQVASWVEQYKQFWEGHLDALEVYLAKIQKQKKYGKRKKHS